MVEKFEMERQQCPDKVLERVMVKSLSSGITQMWLKPELHHLTSLMILVKLLKTSLDFLYNITNNPYFTELLLGFKETAPQNNLTQCLYMVKTKSRLAIDFYFGVFKINLIHYSERQR